MTINDLWDMIRRLERQVATQESRLKVLEDTVEKSDIEGLEFRIGDLEFRIDDTEPF